MAEKKVTKKSVAKKTETKKATSLEELRKELQKSSLLVRSGEEKNTSKISKTKREIARLLTKLNTK